MPRLLAASSLYALGLTVIGSLALAFANMIVPAAWSGVALVAAYTVGASVFWGVGGALDAIESAETTTQEVRLLRPSGVRLAA